MFGGGGERDVGATGCCVRPDADRGLLCLRRAAECAQHLEFHAVLNEDVDVARKEALNYYEVRKAYTPGTGGIPAPAGTGYVSVCSTSSAFAALMEGGSM